MNFPSLLVFVLAFAVACASPGPTIAALVARVLGQGAEGVPFFCLGHVVGDVLWLACAVFGLALLAELFHPVFLALKYLGASYLLYLSWKLWTTPSSLSATTPPARGEGVRLFFGGIALTLGNPKTMLFYLALLPTLVPLADLTWVGFAELAGVVSFIYAGVLTGYVLLAARARRALHSALSMRIVNRVTGTVMTGAAAAIATRA